jgi:hypothetical protein
MVCDMVSAKFFNQVFKLVEVFGLAIMLPFSKEQFQFVTNSPSL